MKVFKNYNILWIVFILVSFYLYTNFCILYGANKQKEKLICVAPGVLSRFDETLKTAETICVNVAQARIEETENLVKSKDAEIQNWKNKFYTLRTSTSSTTTSTL